MLFPAKLSMHELLRWGLYSDELEELSELVFDKLLP